MTTPTSATIVNALVATSCITVGAIAQNSTHADKDTDRLQCIERQAESDAIASAYAFDPYRGTSIGIIVRQREEAAATNATIAGMTANTDGDNSAPESQPRDESNHAPIIDSGSVDELRCAGFDVSAIGAVLGLEWTNPIQSPLSIELYSSTNLAEDVWVLRVREPIAIGATNYLATVEWNETELTQCFLAFGWFIDSDGDGLSNLFEAQISHTNPNLADSDDDGIPDGWEYLNGLNPREDDRMCDPDGDGQTNLEAYLAGMNPGGGDTDGDGIPDARESAWMVQGAASVPWFEFSPIKTVYSNIRNNDDAIFSCEVPFETEICGTSINVAIADINGIVHLGHTSSTNGISTQNSPLYLSRDATSECIAIAAYSTDLVLRESLGSFISFGTSSYNDEIYFVVEYNRVGTYGGSADNAISFQVSFPSSGANKVYVRYGALTDVRNNTRTSIGAQGVKDAFPARLIYKDRETLAGLVGGEIFTYHFGTGTDPNNDDMDGDGLKDGQELHYGTNPRLSDTDFDGLSDGWEIQNGLNPRSASGNDGADGDPDHDGLTNKRELVEGSHPLRRDTDGDGLSDCEEVGYILEESPLPWLSFDSFTDVTASFDGNGFRLVNVDIPDQLNIQGCVVTNITVTGHGWVILNPGGWRRSTSLGYAEQFQTRISGRALYLAPYVANLYLRSGLQQSNSRIRVGRAIYSGARYLLIEYASMYGYDSNAISFQVAIPVSSSDRAYVRYSNVIGSDMTGSIASIGMQTMDGKHRCSYAYHEEGSVSSDNGLTFVFGANTDPTNADSDNDGLSDLVERNIGTNPNRKDTDGDGIIDSWEYDHGLNPLSALDGPANLAAYQNLDVGLMPGTTRDLTFNIYSDYAAWVLEIQGLNDRDRSTRRISMGAPDAGENVTVSLAKGGKYKLSVLWLNCDGHEDDGDAPWYCWQLKIDGKPTEATYEWHAIPRIEGVAEIVSGEGWFVDNRSGLMTNHVHKDSSETSGGNTAEGLEAILYVLDVHPMICDPVASDWLEIGPERVILGDESMGVRIRVEPKFEAFEDLRRYVGYEMKLTTNGTCPEGAQVPVFESDFSVYEDHCEIRKSFTRAQLIDLGVLPTRDEDGIDEMSSYDVGTFSGDDGSNLSDSFAFEQIGKEHRCRASNERSLTLESIPPNAVLSESFFKAAGSEVITVAFSGAQSERRQIMNQADYFYYSGHGYHRLGMVDDFEPAVVGSCWQKDLDCVIFAGCSVLDINDYNANFILDFDDHVASPGKQWEQVGPSILLGYNYYAPSDETGAPEAIIRSWCELRTSEGDVMAWMNANNNRYGRNACAIEKNRRYLYYAKKRFHRYQLKIVNKEDW